MFDSKKFASNSSKGCVLEVDLKHPNELCELHNNCNLVPDKIEIKEKMLSKYQQLIASFHNIPISNVKKLVPNVFDKDKYVFHYENFQLYLRLG